MEPVTPVTLQGRHVRLEPLGPAHLAGLQAIIEGPRDTFGLTPVPRNRTELEAYVATALDEQQRGTVLPFATLDARTGRVLGTTRFGAIEYWVIPPSSDVGRPKGVPHAVEIGWTWLAPSVQRTAVNTEAKRLMLAHAFERWEVYRVSLKTDARHHPRAFRRRGRRGPRRGHLLDARSRVAGRPGSARRPARSWKRARRYLRRLSATPQSMLEK